MKKPKTQIIIVGQTIWPIRWRFVLVRAARTVYHLIWGILGYVALLSLSLRTPYVGPRMRWDIIDALHFLGATPDAQALIPLLVVALFIGRQLWGVVDVLWPWRQQ